MPDMVSCATSTLYEIMSADGMILHQTGQPFLSNVLESTLALAAYESRNWRLPYSLSYYGLYVRTDIFAEQGLEFPTTWDELMDVCEKLKAAGITPFALPDRIFIDQRMMSYMSEDDAEFKQIAAGELAAQDSVVLKACAEASLQLAENMTVASLGAENTESCQQLLAGEAAMTTNSQ